MISPTIIMLCMSSLATSFVIPAGASSLISHHKHILPGAHKDPIHLSRRDNDAVSILLSIAPTSNTCDNSPAPGECATASQAVGPLIASFATYSVTTAPEQAALLSWMAYESADFKYNTNHFPGVPGQGTRCMMSPSFVSQYATSLQITGSSDPASLLNTINSKGLDFGAAAWFYQSQCSDAVKTALKSGSRAGWTGFVSGCVGTTVDEGSGSTSREAYWERAMAALGATIS